MFAEEAEESNGDNCPIELELKPAVDSFGLTCGFRAVLSSHERA